MHRSIYQFCILCGGALLPLGFLVFLLTVLPGHVTTDGSLDSRLDDERIYPRLTVPDETALYVTDGVVITGSLTVADVRTYQQGLTVREGLTVTGALTVTNRLTVGRELVVSGGLIVTGGLTVGVVGEPTISTNKMITGGLLVTDVQTWVGGLTITGALTVTGDLTVIGGLVVTDEVMVTGSLLVRPFYVYLPLIAQNIIIEADNGGFESGSAMWHEYSTAGQRLILPAASLGVPPHSGGWAAGLGRHNDEVSMISQGVSIAKNTSCLSFWQWTVSDDVCNADYGGVGVNGRWVDVHSLCAGTSTAQWVRRQISMTRYTTTTIVLNFAVTNDYSVPSTMYVDDISFQPTSLCANTVQNLLPSTPSAASSLEALIGQPIIPRQHTTVK